MEGRESLLLYRALSFLLLVWGVLLDRRIQGFLRRSPASVHRLGERELASLPRIVGDFRRLQRAVEEYRHPAKGVITLKIFTYFEGFLTYVTHVIRRLWIRFSSQQGAHRLDVASTSSFV